MIMPRQLTRVPPLSLRDALQGDLAQRGDDGILARMRGWLDGGQDAVPCKLYTLIEMGRLSKDARPRVVSNLKTFNALPLLDAPDYQQLKEHGAMLVSHRSGSTKALLDTFGGCNSDIISAWVVSKLEPEPLAAHLRQAMFAYRPDKSRYLFRWYSPTTTPVLFRLGEPAWVKWFFAPVFAWWYPVDMPTGETWSRIEGGGSSVSQSPGKPLVFSEELWEALVNDPFPYRILSYAEKQIPSAFESGCYGVRLAKIEEMLNTAKQHGLKGEADLTTYVLSLLEEPARAQETRWLKAVQQAVAGYAPMTQYFFG